MYHRKVLFYIICVFQFRVLWLFLLSNDDGDANKNGKKAIGFRLAKQQQSVHASRFSYISLPSLHDYDAKLPNFTFYGRREHKTTTFPGLR